MCEYIYIYVPCIYYRMNTVSNSFTTVGNKKPKLKEKICCHNTKRYNLPEKNGKDNI